MSAYEQQEEMIEKVLEDAKIFTSNINQLTHLETFLDNISDRIKPCRIQFINSKVGVRWDWNSGYISVLFGSDDSWEWITESSSYYGNSRTYAFDKRLTFSGGPSYMRKDDFPVYWLPTEVINLVEVPDTFKETYDPVISKHERDIVWVTSVYDGMLAGYCRYNGKLHLFEYVEETEFERHRMFAMFELPLLTRIGVWWNYHIWYNIIYNRVLYNVYTYKWRMGMKWNRFFKCRSSTYETRLAKLKKKYKIVGYFQG